MVLICSVPLASMENTSASAIARMFRLQREAVGDDRGAAVGVEDQAAEVERDAEEQLEAGRARS